MDAFKALRAQMPVCDRCVYLDCAYDCGGSLFGKAAAAKRPVTSAAVAMV